MNVIPRGNFRRTEPNVRVRGHLLVRRAITAQSCTCAGSDLSMGNKTCSNGTLTSEVKRGRALHGPPPRVKPRAALSRNQPAALVPDDRTAADQNLVLSLRCGEARSRGAAGTAAVFVALLHCLPSPRMTRTEEPEPNS